MARTDSFFFSLLSMAWDYKLWWLIPILIIFVGLAFLLFVAESSFLTPFIYTLF